MEMQAGLKSQKRFQPLRKGNKESLKNEQSHLMCRVNILLWNVLEEESLFKQG